MKRGIKKEYIALGVVIALLLAYLLFEKRDKVHYKVPEISPVNIEDIDKIEVKQPDQTIALVKKDSKWLIQPQGYPTDGEKMDKILKIVSQLNVTELVSRSENYSRYDLTKEKAIQVKAYKKGELLREFEVGKMAVTYKHTFVKLKDNPNVYMAQESFRNEFQTKAGELRDKAVMKIDSNEISEVTIEKEGKELLFTKNVKPVQPSLASKKPAENTTITTTPPPAEEETTWLTATGKMGKKSQFDGLMNQLSNLICMGYIEDKTKEDFKSQAPIYTLKLKGNRDYTLTLFPKEKFKADQEKRQPGGERYPVLSSESPYPFWLAPWKAEQLMKKPEDLIEEEKKDPKKEK